MIDPIQLKTSLLCFEAKRWIGILEEGQNAGQLIEIFQRSVDGRAEGEPWCMCFAQYCIKMTEQIFAELFPNEHASGSSIFRSEHCLTIWNKSQHLRIPESVKGSLCIWQKFDGDRPTSSGHTGIVIDVYSNGTLSIVEGNTAQQIEGRIEREGDGVYLKQYKRDRMNVGLLKLKGFLRVW
jgi:CHAP domain